MGPDPARFGVDDPPDESVGAVVRRRVGDEVFERLVAPLLSGVHAGNADRLSLAAGAPQLAAALRDHPSLIGGLRPNGRRPTRTGRCSSVWPMDPRR